jgi:repressor LexA
MKAVGIKSRGHLAIIIERLVEDEKLERMPGVARGFRLPQRSRNPFEIPLKGHIAANNRNPLVNFDDFDPDTNVEIPFDLIPRNTNSSELYALKVEGNSMNDAMIADGDIVILKSGDGWNDGDIVAIWLANEHATTLKKLYRSRSDTVKLKPRSHKHHTRIEKEGDVRVMGRVVAVLRKYDNN